MLFRFSHSSVLALANKILFCGLCWYCGAASAASPELVAPELPRALAEELMAPGGQPIQDCQSEVWELSTRGLGGVCPNRDVCRRIAVRRLVGRKFRRSSLEEFLATDDPQTITFIFVHGNRTDACQARASGITLYNRLFARCPVDRPIRFVFWSWPSEKAGGPLRDARYKADLAERDGHHLCAVLRQIRPDVPITLAGYSFGARIITGALSRVANAEARSSKPNAEPTTRRPYRVVLMAAALDYRWLHLNAPHGSALKTVDCLTCLYNTSDSVLRFYRFVDRHGDPEALGYAGLACRRCLGPYADRYDQQNICRYVGTEHSWYAYQGSPYVLRVLRHHALAHADPIDVGEEFASAESDAASDGTAEWKSLDFAAVD